MDEFKEKLDKLTMEAADWLALSQRLGFFEYRDTVANYNRRKIEAGPECGPNYMKCIHYNQELRCCRCECMRR